QTGNERFSTSLAQFAFGQTAFYLEFITVGLCVTGGTLLRQSSASNFGSRGSEVFSNPPNLRRNAFSSANIDELASKCTPPNPEALYVDELENLLDDFILSFNTEIDDCSIEERNKYVDEIDWNLFHHMLRYAYAKLEESRGEIQPAQKETNGRALMLLLAATKVKNAIDEGLCGKSVDAIDFYQSEIEKLLKENFSFKVISTEGHKNFLTIVDDFSRAVWVFLIKTEVASVPLMCIIQELGGKINRHKKQCIAEQGSIITETMKGVHLGSDGGEEAMLGSDGGEEAWWW
ncbi:hypothetical protein Tco_1315883, partial [Tanacetum coccineum]